MPQTTTRAARLDRAMSLLARRGTLTRFHRQLVRAAGADVDRSGYLVLRRIHLEGPTRITELAELMGVEPSTASRHVQTLEARGWLVKQPDTADRRACMAAVTPAGVELVEQIEVERHRILERALATWTNEELDRFTGLFERFANDLSDLLVALES